MAHAPGLPTEDYEGKPTEHERTHLRRVAGSLPTVAYLICIVEFCERASYYGIQPLISNFVNRPLPVGGNGYGAPAQGTQQTAGALGMGTVKANAVSQSFSMLAYTLPLIFGYLADAKLGRFKLICIGVAVFGVAHAIMVGAGAPNLLASGAAKGPFFISLYMLAVGAAIFKPNISPLLLDQMPATVPTVTETKSGERVIIDPEASTERVMLWFYLLINIGGFMGVATAYSEKYVGWWLAFLIPLILYLPLPLLLWWLRKRLILHPPGGSDLPNVIRILGICFRHGGLKKIGRHGFWDVAKPSVIAARGLNITTQWNDQFVEDVRRAFQATGIFCFFPIQYINDNGLGGSANYLTTMLTTNGVPNDVINNFNSLSIILCAPILNYGLYPLLRKWKIHYGPVARMTTGLFISSIGGAGYTILNYYAYKTGPCGKFGSSETCVDADGVSLVSPITIWWVAIPYALGGISELFINVPAYGIAYSRAPPNMRGVVNAINLLSTGVAYAIGLACSSVIRDPLLTWDFGGPAIAGGILTVVFWFMFKHIDKEEYTLSQNGDHHVTAEGRDKSFDGRTSFNPPTDEPGKVFDKEKGGEEVRTVV
ncbi:major facilitator superfamily domain-containing protein [Elsinoe ampelina]|uniref:Major facilitator superfamily domain-containing protein n=1 Tax=Elsinoe ampelina TaxID=302913 RepID=A0A6A6GB47_9PEZI|nr:major facilitator superfamily domain-containing protein [Elsinoe ampelina]